jgi:hypothetical protein
MDDAAPEPYFPSLEVADVYNNNLAGALPPFGRSQARLQYLHLGGNVFTGSIPEAYGDMEGLEYLGLNGNELSGRVLPSLSRLETQADVCCVLQLVRRWHPNGVRRAAISQVLSLRN